MDSPDPGGTTARICYQHWPPTSMSIMTRASCATCPMFAEPLFTLATVVEQRGQLAEGQAGRGHRLWGELPSAEAGCDALEADDSAQPSQPRARRSRRPYMLPSMAAPAPAAQQPQQPAQRQWQLPRPGKLEDEDGVSDDELILLGSGCACMCMSSFQPCLLCLRVGLVRKGLPCMLFG